jgi:hypothetical protein
VFSPRPQLQCFVPVSSCYALQQLSHSPNITPALKFPAVAYSEMRVSCIGMWFLLPDILPSTYCPLLLFVCYLVQSLFVVSTCLWSCSSSINIKDSVPCLIVMNTMLPIVASVLNHQPRLLAKVELRYKYQPFVDYNATFVRIYKQRIQLRTIQLQTVTQTSSHPSSTNVRFAHRVCPFECHTSEHVLLNAFGLGLV